MYQETEEAEDGPPTQDTPVEPLSFEDRVRARAKAMPRKKTKSAILQIIEIRGLLNDERRSGRTSDHLARILADEGLSVAPGTLRNYLSQIERAILALQSEGNTAPSDADIHRMVNAMEKALRNSVTPEPRQASYRSADQTRKPDVPAHVPQKKAEAFSQNSQQNRLATHMPNASVTRRKGRKL